MKVAITSQGRDLDSTLDERFGRCKYFILVDPETEVFEAVENSGLSASGGAGIQAAQFVSDSGADALITGHVGPNAMRVLQATSVKIYTCSSCTVRQAIRKYKDAELQLVSSATVGSHFGLK